MHKKVFGLAMLLCLLLSMSVTAFAREIPSYFDWYLPTAVSAGIEAHELETLTDEEIMLLFAPYMEIIEQASLLLVGTDVSVRGPTLDCDFIEDGELIETGRDGLLRIMSTISLAEYYEEMMEYTMWFRNFSYISAVNMATRDIRNSDTPLGCFAIEMSINLQNGRIVADKVYYQIQRYGVESFFAEVSELGIESLLTDISLELLEPHTTQIRQNFVHTVSHWNQPSVLSSTLTADIFQASSFEPWRFDRIGARRLVFHGNWHSNGYTYRTTVLSSDRQRAEVEWRNIDARNIVTHTTFTANSWFPMFTAGR